MPNENKRFEKVQSLADWLDRKYRIPGTSIPIGMDGILGLIPGIGDTITLALSSWIIYQAHQEKVSIWIKARMTWNIFIDWLFGLVPLVGDIFDIGWQANQKNAQLLANHLKKKA
jgi:hypothetical protein